MKKLVDASLRKIGLQIKKYPNYDTRRRLIIMKNHEIDVLFDVGANKGQYGLEMRSLGYKGKIVSFEPMKLAFSFLSSMSKKDGNWNVHNYALGSENTKGVINVANNSASSSLQEMLPKHLNAAPHTKYIKQEEIEIRKLDDLYKEFCTRSNNKMIKIDTQGFEKSVLDGAEEFIKDVDIIQIEMSLVPLYRNQMLFVEMIEYLDSRSFELLSLENGFSDSKTGQLLQVDGIFTKRNSN